MITLYHGSNLCVEKPLIDKGRNNLDFGKGFYLTKIQEQAEKWAEVVAERKGRNATAVLNQYLFDYESVKKANYTIKIFESYNIDWLEYVVDCRKGNSEKYAFDLVEGGVANDNVIDTVEDYEKGIITAEQALGQLRYKKVNHQICICNQQILDKFLQFQKSIKL